MICKEKKKTSRDKKYQNRTQTNLCLLSSQDGAASLLIHSIRIILDP